MKAILLTAAIAVGISSFATSAAFAVPVDASFTSDKVNFMSIEKRGLAKSISGASMVDAGSISTAGDDRFRTANS